MRWLKGRLARYLAVSFVSLAILVVVLVISAIYMVRYIQANSNEASTRINLALYGARIRAESMTVVNLAQRYVMPNSNEVARTVLRDQIYNRKGVLDTLIANAVESTTPGDLEERTQLAHIQENVVNLYLQINRLIGAYEAELGYGERTSLEMEKLIREYELPLAENINAFQDYEAERARLAQDAATRAVQTTLFALIFIAVLVAGFMLLMITWSFRRIIMPLAALYQGLEKLQLGQLDQVIPVFGEDEIGLIAQTLNNMAAQLQQTLAGLERNLAELRQTQEALLRSEEHYRSLFNGVPVGLFRSNVDGILLDANYALAEMLRFPDIDALRNFKTVDFYVDPQDREAWRQLIDQQGMTRHFEVRLRRQDGVMIWARENSRAVKDVSGNLLFYEGSLEDISELKQAEESIRQLNIELELRVIERTAQLKAANRELEAFSYSVSHDLRTPLRALDGYSKLLLDEYADVVDETGQHYLKNLRSASQRMSELIDDLLILSRITRTDIRVETIDLSELGNHIILNLKTLEPGRQVEFVVQDGLKAKADYKLMQIALENLLGNAWKFTTKTNGARIEFGCTELDNKHVYYVRDNGAGFEMAYADKLFGAFQRLHSDTEFDGSGIGLATVNRIIRRHGGRIWGEGSPGQGATFYFTLGS